MKLLAISAKLEAISAKRDARPINEPIVQEDLKTNITALLSNIILELSLNPLSINEATELIRQYNADHNTTFSIEQFLANGWLRIINEEARIPRSVERHLRPLSSPEASIMVKSEGYTDEEHCLAIISKRSDERYRPTIEKDRLLALIDQHGPAFSIQDLVSKQIIIPVGEDIYQWNAFRNTYVDVLRSRITAYLWITINAQAQEVPEQDFRRFIRLLIYGVYYWPDDLSNLLSFQQAKALHDAAFTFLQDEQDLLEAGRELRNYFLDSETHLRHNPTDPSPEINFSATNPRELLMQLRAQQRIFHGHFESQASRNEYDLCIHLIVSLGTDTTEPYSTVRKLISDITRPYLLINTWELINRHHAYIIPFLLSDISLIPLAFDLLYEAELRSAAFYDQSHDGVLEMTEKARDDIWGEMFGYVLESAANSGSPEDFGEGIGIVLFDLTERVFSFNSSNYSRQLITHKILKDRYDLSLQQLASKKVDRVNFFPKPDIKPDLVSKIIRPAFNVIKDMPALRLNYRHIYLPVAKLDLELELLRISNRGFQSDQLASKADLWSKLDEEDLVLDIYNILKTYFLTTKAEVEDMLEGRKIEKLERGAGDFGVEIIDWTLCFSNLHQLGLLEKIDGEIRASLSFEAGQNRLNSSNDTSIKKLQVYLRAVLIAYIQCHENTTGYELIGLNIADLRGALENLLSHYISRYSLEDSNSERFDIFKEQYFIFSGHPYSVTLSSLLYRALNLLPEKRLTRLVDDLFPDNADLDRLLSALNTIENKKVRALLSAKISQSDVNTFIASSRSTNELEATMLAAVNSDDHFSLAQPILDRLERHFNSRNIDTPQIRSFLFTIKLLLALKSRSREELEALEPVRDRYLNERTAQLDRKQFYIAILDFYEAKFLESISKLQSLHSKDPENVEYLFYLYKAMSQQIFKNGK